MTFTRALKARISELRAGDTARRKRCIRCENLKARDEFAHDKRVGGKYPWCKACSSKYHRDKRQFLVLGGDASRACPVCDAPLGGTHKNRRYDSTKCRDLAMKWAYYGLSPEDARKMIAAGKSEREIAGRHGGVVAREARELAELERTARDTFARTRIGWLTGKEGRT